MSEVLPMSPDEIVRDYLAAKLPLKQIKILADLNCVDKSVIVKILREAGCTLPKNYDSKGKRPAKTQPVSATETTEPKFLTVGTLQQILAMFPGDAVISVNGAPACEYIFLTGRNLETGEEKNSLELR